MTRMTRALVLRSTSTPTARLAGSALKAMARGACSTVWAARVTPPASFMESGTTPVDIDISRAPAELWDAITEFWPIEEWRNALAIAKLESNWDAFALNDTTDAQHGCGDIIDERDGVAISAERSVGYFQINACNFPDWEWQRLYNARHNAGTAHDLWDKAGKRWTPWRFSAVALGLI